MFLSFYFIFFNKYVYIVFTNLVFVQVILLLQVKLKENEWYDALTSWNKMFTVLYFILFHYYIYFKQQKNVCSGYKFLVSVHHNNSSNDNEFVCTLYF